MFADVAFDKAVAAVRLAWLPEQGAVVNPTVQQLEQSILDLVLAGTEERILMVEGSCEFLTEDQLLTVSIAMCF